jgi:curli biogenesis system outer membrane secretion channel CsgG
MKLSLHLRALGLSAATIAALGFSFSPKTPAVAQSKQTTVQAQSTTARTRPTISVPEFKNETTWWWWRAETARDLAAVLSNELTSTGKFSVVERQKLGTVLSEQELAELGLTRQGTGAKKGQLTGSQYIVLGQVTSYEEGVANESTGGRVGGIRIGGIRIGGGGRKSSQEAYIAIDLRVVDSSTGEVVAARTVEGRATSEASGGNVGVSVGGISLGGDREKAKRAPVGKALRAALIEATNYLSCVMVEKGSCVAKYEEKEQKRRNSSEDLLKLDQ